MSDRMGRGGNLLFDLLRFGGRMRLGRFYRRRRRGFRVFFRLLSRQQRVEFDDKIINDDAVIAVADDFLQNRADAVNSGKQHIHHHRRQRHFFFAQPI